MPFFQLNKQKLVLQGILGTNISQARGTGDFTYWCTCGGHESTSTTPGNCVSSRTTDGRYNCVADGPCQPGCIGSAVTGSLSGENNEGRILGGGGLLVQTIKPLFFHNLKTNE